MTEEEFEKQEEERIYSAWREWRREEIEKKRKQQEQGKGAREQSGQLKKGGEQDSRGLQRDGMNIKERWKRET